MSSRKGSIEITSKKHTRTIGLIIVLILVIALIIGLKIVNQVVNGTDSGLKSMAAIDSSLINSAWFSEGGIKQFFAGPIGLKSFFQFKLSDGNGNFAYPVLFDLLINWIALIVIIFLLVSIVSSFVSENKTNKVINEKGSTTAPEEVKTVTEEEFKQEVKDLQKELNKKPETKKAKPAVKKAKPVAEVKEVEAKKPTPKKTSAPKKVAEVKPTREIKAAPVVTSTKTTEVMLVTKKHYEQTSKRDILEKLFVMYPEVSKKEVKTIVDSAFEIISDSLLNNEEVSIANFGKLEKIEKEARQGINPSNGEVVQIAAANSVKFKAAKHLKELMTAGKWTGLYTVEKEIEVETISESVAVEEIKPVKEVETKLVTKSAKKSVEAKSTKASPVKKQEAKEATEFLSKMENKYSNKLNEKPAVKKDSTQKLTAAQRAKIDGSDSIEESRSELQKHANSLREIAKENNLRKNLKEINLRDLTKKELIVYMTKVRSALSETK